MSIKRLTSLLVIVTLLFIGACKSKEAQKENVYGKHGITFVVPDGWKITTDEAIAETGRLIHCERQGADESGLASIAIVDSGVDLENLVVQTMLDSKASFERMGGSFNAGRPMTGDLNGYKSVSASYTTAVQNMAHTGHVYAFSACNKTILMTLQEADEDHKDNEAGMEKIKKTIKCAE